MKRSQVVFGITTLLLATNINFATAATASLTAKQTTTVKAYFASIATRVPAKIEAGKKNAAASSAAEKYLDLIQKHFTASEFFKIRDKAGNVSPLIQDPTGTYKLSKNVVTLNSYFDHVDGKYSNFTFNKSGKLVDFTFTTSDGKAAKIGGNLYAATTDVTNGGIKISSGYLWKKPNGTAFTQLKVSNIDAANSSWSYAGTKYVAADGVYHVVTTKPVGCLTTKGVSYLEAVTDTSPVVALNTQSNFVLPLYSGCDGGTPSNRVITITLN